MEQTITSYIAQGFTVQSRTETSATMFKKKEFSVLWAVVGLLLCIVPLLVYLIVYATQKDQMVQIVMARAAPAIHWNDDFTQWYDQAGSQWRSTASGLPAGVPISEDGAYFYNGSTWILRPGGATQTPPAPAQGTLPPGPEKPATGPPHAGDGEGGDR
jgi:hypothetical protein